MNIKCTQNIYKSANGVSNVTYYILVPEGVEVRGIVQLSHGMCEYFSRYTAFAKYLCGLGFIVCGNDHIGHGASVSLIARLYLLDYGEKLSGCILIGTVGPIAASGSIVHLADSVARSRGITYRSGLLSNLVFKGFNRKIKQPKTVFDWLSRDEAVVSLYQSDEKCNFVFTATGFRDLFTLITKANNPVTFRKTPKDLPLLFISGDKDPVGRYGEGVRRTVNLYRGSGVKNIEVIFYKDARHEVLNELDRLETFGDISRWLETHLAARAARQAVEQEPETAAK